MQEGFAGPKDGTNTGVERDSRESSGSICVKPQKINAICITNYNLL